MPRTYERKFDWDEARRRRAAGETAGAIARDLGVSVTAIKRVTEPEEYKRMNDHVAAYQRSGRCPDCGTQTTRKSASRSSRCPRCSAIHQSTTVRPTELHCSSCDRWLPDEAFPRDSGRIARRGRHRQCTKCQTVARTEWRRRNPERDRETSRNAKRRKARATDHS